MGFLRHLGFYPPSYFFLPKIRGKGKDFGGLYDRLMTGMTGYDRLISQPVIEFLASLYGFSETMTGMTGLLPTWTNCKKLKSKKNFNAFVLSQTTFHLSHLSHSHKWCPNNNYRYSPLKIRKNPPVNLSLANNITSANPMFHSPPSRKEHTHASLTALKSKARETCLTQVKLKNF